MQSTFGQCQLLVSSNSSLRLVRRRGCSETPWRGRDETIAKPAFVSLRLVLGRASRVLFAVAFGPSYFVAKG